MNLSIFYLNEIFRSSHPKVFLEILQNPQENTCARETLTQVFSCEFCKIFKNTFFEVWTTASEKFVSDFLQIPFSSILEVAKVKNSLFTFTRFVKILFHLGSTGFFKKWGKVYLPYLYCTSTAKTFWRRKTFSAGNEHWSTIFGAFFTFSEHVK